MSRTDSPLWELPKRRPILSLFGVVIAVELVGASGAVFTAQGLESWYGTLERPAIAPPNWVFAPVWTTLFALMGLGVWLVWRRANDPAVETRAVRLALAVFWVHMGVNVAWSLAFFGLRSLEIGLAVIAILWVLIVVTAWLFDRVDRRAALVLVPYLVWVSFASYLNYRFLVLN